MKTSLFKRFASSCAVAACVVSPLLISTGCKSTQSSYEDPNKVQIVGQKWNETDARLSAEEMIGDCLNDVWLTEWQKETKKDRPFVLVDDFENRTSEQIDTKQMFENVREDLIKSRKVRFLDGEQREKILKEYRYQTSGVVKPGTAKGPGQQASADFYLLGSIGSIVSQEGGTKTVTYQVEMRLTNIATSEIVWTKVKKIKKQFQRSSFGG